MIDADSLPKFSEYFRSAYALQTAIDLNYNDQQFSSRKNAEIIYFFDANICISYLNADEPLQPGNSGLRGLFSKSTGETIDRLALRFLFEGFLPGQKGQQIFLSPPHWNETLNILDRLSRGHKFSIAESQPIDKEIIFHLRKFTKSPSKLLEEAAQLDVAETLRKIASMASLEKRIQNLWLSGGNGSVSRVASGESTSFWAGAADRIRHQDFKFWQNKIGIARSKHNSKNGKSKSLERPAQKDDRAIDNDAITISAIQAMYRESPEATGINPTKRFLFVTSDTVLISVLHDFRERLQCEGIHSFVRSPTTYMPIINYEYLHSHVFENSATTGRSQKLIADIRTAIDSATSFVGKGQNLSPWSEQEIEYAPNVKRWSDVAEFISIAGAEFFSEDFDPKNRDALELARLIENDEVSREVGNVLSDQVSDIRADHTRQITAAAIDVLDQRVRERKVFKRGTKRSVRAPLKFHGIDVLKSLKLSDDPRVSSLANFSDFLQLLGSETTGEGGESIAQLAVKSIKGSWSQPDLENSNYLLAASVYFSVAAWNSAKNCSDICINKLNSESNKPSRRWLREAQYASALALRMMLRSRSDFTEARALLTENMSMAYRDISYSRDKIERAALIMTACVVQNLGSLAQHSEKHQVEFIDEDQLQLQFEFSIKELREAIEIIGNDYLGESNIFPALLISLQAETNILAGLLFDFFMSVSKRPPHIFEIATQVERLDAATNELGRSYEPSFAVRFYRSCGIVLQDPTEEKLDEFEIIFKEISNNHPDLTWADRNEQKYFLRETRKFVHNHSD